jgi:hypothetical protein
MTGGGYLHLRPKQAPTNGTGGPDDIRTHVSAGLDSRDELFAAMSEVLREKAMADTEAAERAKASPKWPERCPVCSAYWAEFRFDCGSGRCPSAVLRPQPTDEQAAAQPNPKIGPICQPEGSTEGRKHDAGKPRTDLLPPDALLETARVMGEGAARYGDRDWEKGTRTLCEHYAALQRHLLAWHSGEDADPLTGRLHMAYVAARAQMILALVMRGAAHLDDRPR